MDLLNAMDVDEAYSNGELLRNKNFAATRYCFAMSFCKVKEFSLLIQKCTDSNYR